MCRQPDHHLQLAASACLCACYSSYHCAAATSTSHLPSTTTLFCTSADPLPALGVIDFEPADVDRFWAAACLALFAWPPLQCCSQRCRASHRSKESLHQVALLRFAKTAVSPAYLGQVVSCDALTSCLAPSCPVLQGGTYTSLPPVAPPRALLHFCLPRPPHLQQHLHFAVRLHLPRASAGQPCTASTHLHVCTPAARPPCARLNCIMAVPLARLASALATESSSPLPALRPRLHALNHNSLHLTIG